MKAKPTRTPFSLREKVNQLPTAVRLIGGLLLMVWLGTSALMLPMMSKGDPLSFREAIFTAVSALTVTGLSIITPAADLTWAGKFTLLALIQFGGVGYMVLAILVFRLLGRDINFTDRMALQDALGLINSAGIVKLTFKVLATVFALEGLGATALLVHWNLSGVMSDRSFGVQLGYAIFHATSSFCNAGFDLFAGYKDFPTDPVTLFILGSMIFLGGLGIPILSDLFKFRRDRKLSLHTRLTLVATFALMFGGALLLFMSESRTGNVLHGLTLGEQIKFSWFQSVSSRTAGFVGMPRFESLDGASQLVIMSLMFVGCAPASMGGGMTTGTLIVMALALIAYIKRQSTPIVAGKAIPGEMVRKAAAILAISLFAVSSATFAILVTHDTTLDKAAFEVISAFATCGLTLAFTSELNDFGLFVIMTMMFWGRLGALSILFALTRSKESTRVKYPEEKILIG